MVEVAALQLLPLRLRPSLPLPVRPTQQLWGRWRLHPPPPCQEFLRCVVRSMGLSWPPDTQSLCTLCGMCVLTEPLPLPQVFFDPDFSMMDPEHFMAVSSISPTPLLLQEKVS